MQVMDIPFADFHSCHACLNLKTSYRMANMTKALTSPLHGRFAFQERHPFDYLENLPYLLSVSSKLQSLGTSASYSNMRDGKWQVSSAWLSTSMFRLPTWPLHFEREFEIVI